MTAEQLTSPGSYRDGDRLPAISLRGLAWLGAIIGLSTAVCELMHPYFDLSNLIMIYLLGVAFLATRVNRLESVLGAFFSVLSFDLFFVPPRYSFGVEDAQYLVTFAVMLIVALLISALTLRVRRQAEIAERAMLEREREQVRNTLLSSISHDLRTPLASISGAVSALIERPGMSEPNRQDLLETIRDESSRLGRIVRNVLDITRVESGAAVRRDWNSLEELVGSALERAETQVAGREIIVELDPKLPLLNVDATLVEQALVNLLENAGKHTPAGSPLRVVGSAQEHEVVLSVEDRGPGVPDAEKARIFEKLYRGTKSGGGGFGLGLAICRSILDAHGGRIEVVDRVGGGSCFSLHFPATERAPDVPNG